MPAEGSLGAALVGEKVTVNNMQLTVTKFLGEGQCCTTVWMVMMMMWTGKKNECMNECRNAPSHTIVPTTFF